MIKFAALKFHNFTAIKSKQRFGPVDKVSPKVICVIKQERRRRIDVQLSVHMAMTKDLVPQEHFLRKPETALDLSSMCAETVCLHSRKNGRLPPNRSVMLPKYFLVGYLYGIPAKRQIEQCIRADAAPRRHLGWICLTAFRITSLSVNCGGENCVAARYFGGCSRRSLDHVYRKVMETAVWRRILLM